MIESSVKKFDSLPSGGQQRYRTAARQMTSLAIRYSIPINFGPKLQTIQMRVGPTQVLQWTLPQSLGKIDGGTGCVMKRGSDYFVVTAEHVLEGYEKRIESGETLDWVVGGLRFDPLSPESRIAFRGSSKYASPTDIVFLRISEQEAERACDGRSDVVPSIAPWPPDAPREGDSVLVAGFPNVASEIHGGRNIQRGAFAAMLGVTSVGAGYFKCRYEYDELLSFDGKSVPLAELSTDLGGWSGGPVFAVREISYPFVGVISQRCGGIGDADVVVVATLEGVPSHFVTSAAYDAQF